jgi:hypothetical protein
MALVREIVIVISDLYLADADTGRSSAGATPALPGLENAVRFGQRSALQGDRDWRSWLARSIGRDDLASAAPAAVAAAGDSSAGDPATGTVWIATPIHLLAGLTSLHLDFRGLLQLSKEDIATLVQDFTTTFGDSEFQLRPSQSGSLLLRTRDSVNAVTTDPTRALANDLEASLPTGPDAGALKRLGAEMEMWLHSHPVNEARARRGELPISTLWLWGGGPTLSSADLTPRPAASAAFGSEPYLVGLCRLSGTPLDPLPERLPEPTQLPNIEGLLLVAQLAPLLLANPNWTMFDALAQIDRAFIEPAVAHLRGGHVNSLLVVANDRQLHVRRQDHLKFWRRRPKSAIRALRDSA